jgi:hypothetical protein
MYAHIDFMAISSIIAGRNFHDLSAEDMGGP